MNFVAAPLCHTCRQPMSREWVFGVMPRYICLPCTDEILRCKDYYKKDKMMKGKELQPKEAIKIMINGGQCVNDEELVIYFKRNMFMYRTETLDEHQYHFRTDSKYYAYEKTPELLEGVGKMHILKRNENVQLMLQHCADEDKYGYFFQDSNGYKWQYETYEGIKENWHIIG